MVIVELGPGGPAMPRLAGRLTLGFVHGAGWDVLYRITKECVS